MRQAALRANGLTQNSVFDRNNPGNRDDCFVPYIALRDRFRAAGIDLNTVDQAPAADVAFELHLDVQRQTNSANNYLLMLETRYVHAANGDAANWDGYRRIFTWNDELVDNDRFIKINPPNPLAIHAADGFKDRAGFCCLIAGNKTLPVPDVRNLYPERVKAIRWFEENAPAEFDLYGVEWDIPTVRNGLVGKFQRLFWRKLSRLVTLRPYPSYRGKVASKRDVLAKTRFAVCYENVRDVPGYITEKIFDCLFSGCVPVYWGANNITDYVPADCFIDRRQFADTAEMYRHLKRMSEAEFIGYQERIAAYLGSDAALQFGTDYFAETIVNTIVNDLGA